MTTQLGLLPYIGIVPDIGLGTIGQGEDIEFLWPDRVVSYLQRYAPPDIWTVVGDYPCTLNVMEKAAPGGVIPAQTFYLDGSACAYTDDPLSCSDRLLLVHPVSPVDWTPGPIGPSSSWAWAFEMLPGELPFGVVPAGTWTGRLYVQNTGASSSTSVEVIKIEPDGTQTVVGNDAQPNPSVGPFYIDFSFSGIGVTFNPEDRMFVLYQIIPTGGADTEPIYHWGDGLSYLTSPSGATPPIPVPRVFTNPTDDRAPWTFIDGKSVLDYAPEAADLLGIIITNIEGLGSTISRNATRKTNELEGGTLEKEHAGPREIKVTAVAVATSSMGIEWAERWLTRILAEPLCDSCAKGAYSFRQCCPPDETPAVGYWATFGVGLLSGPTFTPLSTVDAQPGDLTRQSCYVAQVEFTIGAEDPYLYKPWTFIQDISVDGGCASGYFAGIMGIDGLILDFGDSTAGGLTYTDTDGNSHDLFTFSIAGWQRLVWDGSRGRVIIFNLEGGLVYPFSGIDTGGEPLDYPAFVSQCAVGPAEFCASFDGTAVHVYQQHKELG